MQPGLRESIVKRIAFKKKKKHFRQTLFDDLEKEIKKEPYK
jgi:hypothetical protein